MVPINQDEDPKTCNEWKKLEDPTQVTKAITRRLQQHFRQAQHCT
jgi:hypothetical protein